MSNASQFCLKGFTLKMMVVEPKMVQSVESNEEPVDLFSSTDQRVQTPFLSSRTVVQPVKIEPQPVEVEPQSVKVWSRGGQGPMVTCQTLHAND